MISTVAHLNRLLEGMVHGSVQEDRLLTLRHRQSIAAHLATGLAALAALPVWLVLGGPASPAEGLILVWLVTPLATAGLLARSGRFGTAHLLAAAAGAAFITALACLTGGLDSPILLCLALLPIEASLSGSRPVVAASLAMAGGGFVAVSSASAFGLAAAGGPDGTDAILAAAILLYAGGIAFRLYGLARGAAASAGQDEARYRLVADHVSEMVTRHAANGDVDFASPSARALTGAAASRLLGDGLFRRVHVGDRPAYLKALSEARVSRREGIVELRLRRSQANGGSDDFIEARMRCRPMIGRDGSVSAVIAVTRDRAEPTREARAARPAVEQFGTTVSPIGAARTPPTLQPAEQTIHQPEERKSA